MAGEIVALQTNVANLNAAVSALATRVAALQTNQINPADVQAQSDQVAAAVTAINAIAPTP